VGILQALLAAALMRLRSVRPAYLIEPRQQIKITVSLLEGSPALSDTGVQFLDADASNCLIYGIHKLDSFRLSAANVLRRRARF
jgi:hypothetical protein